MNRRIVAAVAVMGVLAGIWFLFLRPGPTITLSGPTTGTGTALLIPGHGGGKGSLGPLAAALESAGWTVRVVDIGDGSEDIAEYGRQVALEAREAASGGRAVALVGYSMGGLIARSAVAQGASDVVSRVVTVASPHEGTKIAGIGAAFNAAACDASCRQMAPGSDFLSALPTAQDSSRWLAIYSDSDDVVLPVESAALDGASVVRLQDPCPERVARHGQVISDPYTLAAVPQFLSDGNVLSSCPAA